MQADWLVREGNRRVVIFALGWAADTRVVAHIRPSGCDVLALGDYRTLEALDDAFFESYAERYLFAWSFGVWAAEQILRGVRIDHAVALNGTPLPVDERYGIEPKRLSVTIRGFRRSGTREFDKRTYGVWYEQFGRLATNRTEEDKIEELEMLAVQAACLYVPNIKWSKAIVGSEDVIFSPENMLRYWGIRAEVLPLPHYPFGDAGLIEREIDNR